MAHGELAQLAERISDDRLRDPAMGDWKGKDVLAHLAWWHDHSVLVIEGLRAGRQPYDGTDPANTTDGFDEPPRAPRRSPGRDAGCVQSIARAAPGGDQAPDPRRPLARTGGRGWAKRRWWRRCCGTPRVTTRHTTSTWRRWPRTPGHKLAGPWRPPDSCDCGIHQPSTASSGRGMRSRSSASTSARAYCALRPERVLMKRRRCWIELRPR